MTFRHADAAARTIVESLDAAGWCIECGVSGVNELREIFRRFFPHKDLPPRAALRLEELAADIRAKLR